MKNINELPELMVTVIEGSKDLENDGVEFSAGAVNAIHEIAEYARETNIYKSNQDISNEFWQRNEKTVRNVYVHLLDRVVNAPTSIHRDISVLLIIPILDDLLVNKCTGDEIHEKGV